MNSAHPHEDYFARREEEEALRRDRWRLTAGISEFMATVIGCAVILLLVLLIVSLFNWLRTDFGSTFSVFISMLRK